MSISTGHPFRPLAAAAAWLRAHDPGHGALRRAARTAILMPGLFALCDRVIGDPAIATFAAFGSFAMLLLVDFGGSIEDRLLDQAALGLACVALICLGTLVSQHTWLAAVTMLVLAFAVLFAAVVSSVLAGATTTLLLALILPISIPGPPSSIPERIGGWGIAAGASLLAISLLWPSPTRNPVRVGAVAAVRALAERLRADVAYVMSAGSPDTEDAHRAAAALADERVHALQRAFFATPYRPTGLATDARAVIRLVDELRWLHAIVRRSAPKQHPPRPDPSVCAVKRSAAAVLDCAADQLEDPRRPGEEMAAALATMRGSLEELERATIELISGHDGGAPDAERVISSLDPSFRAQELSFIVAQIATNTGVAAAAARRSWVDRALGRQPEGIAGPISAAQERAGSHAARNSAWLHNSMRGAVALALAVTVADVGSVQHGFWVAFGTLSVLRSNALSTGQNIVRALIGTTAGFIVGGVLVYAIGTNTTVLWVLLPLAVLAAGLAPATISFAAGQAGFTLVLLILFNLLAPAGWKIGLVRIEDVALGGAVSLLAGLLFWPRGAGSALARALSQAYADGARYLAGAVDFGVSCCDAGSVPASRPRRQALEAAASARRLDDAFRGYLAERGAKRAPLADITGLVTGVAALRLAGDAVIDLWDGSSEPGGERSAARRELLSSAAVMSRWYEHFATSLAGAESVPEPLERDQVADGRLIEAVERDLRDAEGHATAIGVRVIWTGDHLDAVRRLQGMIVPTARASLGGGHRADAAALQAAIAPAQP
jgi:uncharacterized membrane protein YccC